MRLLRVAVTSVLVASLAAAVACVRPSSTNDQPAAFADEPSAAREAIRLSGTVEAVQSRSVIVPRLQGPFAPLVIIGLVPAGARVEPGDVLVEFDPQQQERDAFDRQAELSNLEGEILKKRGEQAALEAKDRTAVTAAEHDVERARLDVRQNELLPRIEAEKNTLALTQASARLDQLRTTFTLKRRAAAADLRILEIRRERAERALRYAESNARLMTVTAPFGGLVVLKRIFRNNNFVEVAEGDDVRPGTAIIDIVDTSAMRVRALVNQADARLIRIGQRVNVGLDGFPDLVFDGEVDSVAPLSSPSRLTPTVRSSVAIIAIRGSHPQLLPDLTAWVDVVPGASPPAIASREP